MCPKAVRLGDATIIKVNNLTYVIRAGVDGFWLDEASGLVGIDDAEANTHWGTLGADGFVVVKVEETTSDQYQLIEALTMFEG